MTESSEIKSYFDLEGDGGSNVMEQVLSQKAEIEKRLSGIKEMVAIASGKGGVGKSTLSMQLAVALNAMGNSVCILDADFNGPSLARLSGLGETALIPGAEGLIVPRTERGIGVLSMGTIVPETEAVDFTSVASGESHVWRATKEFSTLAEFLRGTDWGELDFLLIDLPPGAERCFQFAEFFGKKTRFLMVTIPSDVSQGVVSRSVVAVEKAESTIIGYVENMSGYYCAETSELRPLFPRGDLKLDYPLLGQVPFDPELARNCDKGRTIEDMPDTPVARAIFEIGREILKILKISSQEGTNPAERDREKRRRGETEIGRGRGE